MRKLFSAVAMAVAMFSASAANAASVVFQFDEANSDFDVSFQSPTCLFGGCGLTATLYDPISDLELDVGETGQITFGMVDAYGWGGDADAVISLTLAFLNPAGASIGNGASVVYATFGGLASGGKIDWFSNSQTVTAANGTEFTVVFDDLKGLQLGSSKELSARITLDSVVPEPASWALMIGGFGMAGATLRRRRALAAL